MLVVELVVILVAAATGVGVGLSQNSANWAFAAGFMFLAFCWVVSFAFLAVRKQLGPSLQIYRQAWRKGLFTWWRKD